MCDEVNMISNYHRGHSLMETTANRERILFLRRPGGAVGQSGALNERCFER